MQKYLSEPTIRKTDSGVRYYSTAIPVVPSLADINYTVVSVLGDRWDTLAYKYLGSAKFWYVLASANNGANGSMFIKPGTVITIPEV
jgi:hypothetical protein